jgi:CRP-like cAMP-binding protein
VETFEQIPLFQGLTLDQVDLLRPIVVSYDCFDGTVLFEQGEPAVFLYLVLSGEIQIQYKPDDGPPITVSRVHAGGIIGWSAVIGRATYTSAAICEGQTRMLRLRGSDLRELREKCPETGALILERMANSVAERLKNANPQVIALLQKSLSEVKRFQENDHGNTRPD